MQEFFNLDVIIAVGYRVNSKRATQFRIWATRVLKEFLLRGYSVNSRLNQLEDKMDRRLAKHDDDIAELKDKVDFFVQTKEPRSRHHRGKNGRRDYLRASRLNPQGDDGTPRIRQAVA